MSLLGFLEFGGEAVIRGLLSRLDPTELRAVATGFEGPTRSVLTRLSEKGYDRFGVGEQQMRSVISRAAESMDLANRLNRGESVGGPGATKAPNFPTTLGGDLIYTVKITYQNPDGTTSDAVVQVASKEPLGRAQVREEALEAAGERSGIVSDPADVLGSGRSVSGVQVISIYSGEVIRP
jgi:hypothetical protein